MEYTIYINFSLFGFVILGLLVWGGYRGFVRGGIVTGLSLFALLSGLVISAILTKFTYKYFWLQDSKVPDVFGSVVLGLSFMGAIWFAQFVQRAVHVRIKDTNPDKTNNIIGAMLGVVKWFIITAVYSVVILNLDYNGHFLPERDAKSQVMNMQYKILTKSVRMLRMDYHRPAIDENNQKQDDSKQQTTNNGINFKNTTTKKDSSSSVIFK